MHNKCFSPEFYTCVRVHACEQPHAKQTSVFILKSNLINIRGGRPGGGGGGGELPKYSESA